MKRTQIRRAPHATVEYQWASAKTCPIADLAVARATVSRLALFSLFISVIKDEHARRLYIFWYPVLFPFLLLHGPFFSDRSWRKYLHNQVLRELITIGRP